MCLGFLLYLIQLVYIYIYLKKKKEKAEYCLYELARMNVLILKSEIIELKNENYEFTDRKVFVSNYHYLQ